MMQPSQQSIQPVQSMLPKKDMFARAVVVTFGVKAGNGALPVHSMPPFDLHPIIINQYLSYYLLTFFFLYIIKTHKF